MASASRRKPLLLFAYALSGCAALIYEVVWTRLLTQQMGQSAWAVSTVLAAFMAGLGAGALAGGAAAVRVSPSQALRLYAALEGTIAVCAVAMLPAVSAITPLLSFAYAGGEGTAFAAARLGVALVLILVPAAAMGATFPIAARAMVACSGQAASSAGALYAANTGGAFAGALVAGIVLVPVFGLRRASFCAVALNVLAALAAMWLAGARGVPIVSAAGRTSARGARRAPRAVTRPMLAALTVALSGFVALVHEVAWTRVLALTIGPTTYAFGAMLALFILGLAIGSAAAARLAPRIRYPAGALGGVLVLCAAFALAAMRAVDTLPLQIADLVRGSDVTFGSVLRAEMARWAILILPLAAAFGAAFPLALHVAIGDEDRTPKIAATLYGANTAGSLLGSLAGGFLLVPLLGSQRTIEATALLMAIAGVVVIAAGGARRAIVVAACAVVAVLAGTAAQAPRWDAALLAAGAYKYAPYLRGPDLESALRAGSLLYYRDGAAGTVSVRRAAGALTLSIDGKVDASNAGDMLTQKLLAHVPLMLHAHPRRVAIIGLGSGVTLGAALRHPVERVDTIEISPEVVDASSFFEIENHRALADARTRLIVGDGRSHLLLAPAPYDVIISEPSNPWMAGVASLFTREFFLAARRALAGDGILCQWAHTYDIAADDLRSIAATFASAFPDGTIWLVGQGDLLLIGSPAGVVSRLPAIATSFDRPGVAGDLAEVSVPDAASVLAMYAGGPGELRAYSAGGVVQTDDRNTLEFSAARSIVSVPQHNAEILRGLAPPDRLPSIVAAARTPSDASKWRERGRMELAAESYGAAYDAFARAVTGDPSDQTAIDGLVDASAGAEKQEAAVALLRTRATRDLRGVAAHVGLSRLLAVAGNVPEALEQVVPLIASLPDDPRPAEQGAAILADIGDADRLRPLAERLAERWPSRSSGTYFMAAAAFLEGRREDAERLARQGLAAHGNEARLQTLLGAVSASLDRRDAARIAFHTALKMAPRDAVIYANLGLLDLDGGSPESAAGRFAEALLLDPSSAVALRGLAQALRQTGHPERAARVEQAARR